MRIGILTYHSPLNFGANLQAYTSKCLYESLGHKVFVINYVAGKTKGDKTEVDIKAQGHITFVKRHLCDSPELYTGEDVLDFVRENHIELIVVGADAVWNKKNAERLMVFCGKWLFDSDLAGKVQVVSMSPAFMGTTYTDIPDDVKQTFKRCLEQFTYLTVRDNWTQERINNDIFGCDYIKNVNPDPVIWLSDYLKDYQISYPEGVESDSYIVMSLPSKWATGPNKGRHEKWFETFKEIVHKNGLKLVELPLPEGPSGMEFDYSVPYPIDPRDWFCWIRGAKAFCGLRFHAVVSCIANGVPFFSSDVYGKNSRFLTVFNRIGLYRLTGKFDKQSKIHNLLLGSAFESNRVHGNIDSVPPTVLFSILNQTLPEEIIKYRDKLRSQYSYHLEQMFYHVGETQKNLKIFSLGDTCTGCSSCVNVCPTGAIKIGENHRGFYYPELTPHACIDCKLCEKSCPKINKQDYHTPAKAYYGWSTDDKTRKTSSSGGAFTTLAEYVINEKKGVVYGASFNYGHQLRLECHSSLEVGLDPLKKSKYVQCFVGKAFKEIRDKLIDGIYVLYCGTPCQVAGLKTYLRKDYPNLVTCDFICHGVPSMDLLKKHLDYLGFTDISSINFRPKKYSAWVDNIIIRHHEHAVYDMPYRRDPYFYAFEKKISLRSSCFDCEFSKGGRAADITLADFAAVKRYDANLYDKKGLSMIHVNTDAGEELLKMACANNQFQLFDLDYAFAQYVYDSGTSQQAERYNKQERDSFIEDVYTRGYKYSIQHHQITKSLINVMSEKIVHMLKKFAI